MPLFHVKIPFLPALLIFTILFAVAANHSAGQPPYPADPGAVVKAFCQQDYEGAGLASATWEALQTYTQWEDAPGWDHITVISGYNVAQPHVVSNVADVNVVYRVVATINAGERLSSITFNDHSERMAFKLTQAAGRWQITEPQEPPHVSVGKAVTLLRNELRSVPSSKVTEAQTVAIRKLAAPRRRKGSRLD